MAIQGNSKSRVLESTVRQRHGQTDRRTDGRMTYDSNTALALRALRGKNENNLSLRGVHSTGVSCENRGTKIMHIFHEIYVLINSSPQFL